MSTKTVCRVCGSHHVEIFLDLGAQPHCNRLVPEHRLALPDPIYPLRVGFCHDCTLVQIDHTIPKEQMFSDYPYVSGTTQTLIDHFKETAERLVATYGLKAGDRVVDIGSNDGSWLAQYTTFGLTTLGVEAAENVAKIAVAKGIPTLNRFFDDETARHILAEHGPAKLVTAAGVFFHLEDLHGVVHGIDRLIGQDGVLVVQAIYLGGMIDNLAFDQIYHEHLCYYTLRSLESLLARHGLAVFDVDLLPIHGGSIEVHVARAGARTESGRVVAFREAERRNGLGELATYRRFGERVWQLRDELLALLRNFRAKGRTIYAFGAPAKGATLLNTFGIGPDLVEKAVEKNPLKVGLTIPGCRIPIVAEGGAVPDAYLMLAWNFLDEFLAHEKPYLDAGGQFIVPIPALRVLSGQGAS